MTMHVTVMGFTNPAWPATWTWHGSIIGYRVSTLRVAAPPGPAAA